MRVAAPQHAGRYRHAFVPEPAAAVVHSRVRTANAVRSGYRHVGETVGGMVRGKVWENSGFSTIAMPGLSISTINRVSPSSPALAWYKQEVGQLPW